MDLKYITELVQLISKSGLKEFEYQEDNIRICIKNSISSVNKRQDMLVKSESLVPILSSSIIDSIPKHETSGRQYLSVRSPMIGTFYQRAAPDKEPFVKLGDKIEMGQTICIIEAMKLFNQIESEISGSIIKILVQDATPVEYDQELFLVDPT